MIPKLIKGKWLDDSAFEFEVYINEDNNTVIYSDEDDAYIEKPTYEEARQQFNEFIIEARGIVIEETY